MSVRPRVPIVFPDSSTQSSAASNDLKDSCKAASTTNVSLTAPGATLDGVTLVSGDRIFLKDQTAAAENGIYTWTGSAATLTRTTDADSALKVSDSMIVTVEQGTVNADSMWELQTNNPITIGTTALLFSRTYPPYKVASTTAGLDQLAPTNAILENFPRWYTTTAQAGGASGVARVFPIGVLRAGQTASSIRLFCTAAASGAPTNSWAGIATFPSLVIRGISATSLVNPTANSFVTFTFGATYTPTTDIHVVGFVMYQVATPPTFAGLVAPNAAMVSGPVIQGASGSGLTTPPATGTSLAAITAGTSALYAYLT